ncbi:MAG: tRNA (adenosine(37)-N6)-threonylcarbamoyltransferase complex ATPase subunit type 1 TsaE [Limnochordales bacterium]|nr:tRNA (adenosine(37)-N6)-threonylcarbamoyltransferase complex ATPase subunit type 1 TsaE [Limnochordales bacterium]
MEQLGEELGRRLWPGAVLALNGPLGAGKTTLTRGIARGLGGRPDQVRSPTFTLIHQYPGRLPLYHLDAYRLQKAAEWENLGPEEYLEGDGVTVIEWAEKVITCLPAELLEIEIAGVGLATRRLVTLRPRGDDYRRLVSEVARVWRGQKG